MGPVSHSWICVHFVDEPHARLDLAFATVADARRWADGTRPDANYRLLQFDTPAGGRIATTR